MEGDCTNFPPGCTCESELINSSATLLAQEHYVDTLGSLKYESLKNFGFLINPRIFWCQNCKNRVSVLKDHIPTTQELVKMVLKFFVALKEFLKTYRRMYLLGIHRYRSSDMPADVRITKSKIFEIEFYKMFVGTVFKLYPDKISGVYGKLAKMCSLFSQIEQAGLIRVNSETELWKLHMAVYETDEIVVKEKNKAFLLPIVDKKNTTTELSINIFDYFPSKTNSFKHTVSRIFWTDYERAKYRDVYERRPEYAKTEDDHLLMIFDILVMPIFYNWVNGQNKADISIVREKELLVVRNPKGSVRKVIDKFNEENMFGVDVEQFKNFCNMSR